MVAFGFILWPTLAVIFSLYDGYYDVPTIHYYGPLIYALFLTAVFLVYSRWQPDLFMLTMAMLSLIIVLTALIGLTLAEVDDVGSYFITGFSVIVQAGIAVTILRRIAQRWEDTTV